MFTHLLIPLDGSKLAEKALPVALEIAARFDSRITLLRVTTPPYVPAAFAGADHADLLEQLRAEMQGEARDYLHALQTSLAGRGFHTAVQLVEGDPVAEHILEAVYTLQADALVMSTHGRGGFRRWVFGSIADKVLQQATVPVLLIRAEETPLDWSTAQPATAS
jgi:nucleotide-binding universal stress UspA family protein